MELHLFSSLESGKNPIEQMPPQHRSGWSRSIRRMGGYWAGSFDFQDYDRGICNDFFYSAVGAHIEERDAGITTWEGRIMEVDSPALKNGMWTCAVNAFGYVKMLSKRKLRGAYVDGATGNASTWIADILSNQATTILANQIINVNTMQVVRKAEFDRTLWDEISRITELGDGASGIWRFYVSAGRLAYYEAIDRTTVKYYVNGGMIRRRSELDMTNYIYGSYTDAAGTETALAAASNSASIALYDQFESTIRRQSIPQAAMESLRDRLLEENAYPWPQVLGSAGPIPFLDASQKPVSPWQVTPGIIRDLSYPVGAGESGGFLSDRRDTYPDEIVCSEDGASVRSWQFREADLLALQYDYASRVGETDYDLKD